MKGRRGVFRFSVFLIGVLVFIMLPASIASANISEPPSQSAGATMVMAGDTIGIVASVPVSTGTIDEYNLFLSINGEQVWVAATTTDFPDLFTIGAVLSGTLDYSSGWWTFKKAGSGMPTPQASVRVIGIVETMPTYTGTADEYSLLLTVNGQQYWVVASNSDFPQLLAVGSPLGGYLDNSSGQWTFKKDISVAATPPVSGSATGTVANIPASTGATDEYNLFVNINGEQVWVAATTTDFPQLFAVGATVSGTLDYSLGWWTFKKL